MRRQLVMAIAAAALIVPSAAAFADHEDGHTNDKGNACPEESENPEGTPPNCGNGGNGEVPDNDGDGIPNNEDNCPAVANPGQEDENTFEDGEGAGDACEEPAEEQPPAEEEPPVEEPGVTATCAEGGVAGATVANQVAGTENEEGPISSELHANEDQFGDAAPVVHEVSCLVATVDNNLQ